VPARATFRTTRRSRVHLGSLGDSAQKYGTCGWRLSKPAATSTSPTERCKRIVRSHDTFLRTRRIVVLLLMLVPPIQFGLAATADLLEHVIGSHPHHAASHNDDTVHSHAAHDDSNEATHEASSSSRHSDYGACHFFHSLALTAPNEAYARPTDGAAVVSVRALERLPSASSVRPERPKWIAFV
jgi:hypothetical protein